MLNVPITQVIVNATSIVKGTTFIWVPHVTFLLQNPGTFGESLSNFLSQLPLLGLTRASKKH